MPSATTGMPISSASRRDGLDDLAVARLGQHGAHEGAVDLEGRDRQGAEIAEARVAGAEIVDGDAHAALAAERERVGRARGIAHQGALGDLELEVLRGDT